MIVAHEDVRSICGVIAGICDRLAQQWSDHADNMNVDASERLEAACRGAKLKAAGSAIRVVVDGSCSMAVRMVEAENRLSAVTKIVRAHEKIDAKSLGNFEQLVQYGQLIQLLKRAID